MLRRRTHEEDASPSPRGHAAARRPHRLRPHPYGGGAENNSIATAIQFDPPTKSWTLYNELHEAGEVEYYKLHLKAGDKLQFSVATPRGEDAVFVPDAVVMYPNATDTGQVPAYVEVQPGYGATLIQGVRQSAPSTSPSPQPHTTSSSSTRNPSRGRATTTSQSTSQTPAESTT